MNMYILDTGILLGYIRGSDYAKSLEEKYSVSTPPNISLISVVSYGEILSLSLKLKWGKRKIEKLQNLLGKIPVADINRPQILNEYAEIDAYSQNKHPNKKLPPGMTARNMSHNDIWIAATTSVLNATLVTTDRDFDHLHNSFLDVIYIDQNKRETNQ